MFAAEVEAPDVQTRQPLATLILADNQPEDSRSLATALTHLGYRVIKVIDGQQLLSLVDSFTPDVILIDSQLTYTIQADYSTANVSYTSEELPSSAAREGINHQSDNLCDGYALCRMLSQGIDTMGIPIILLGATDDFDSRLRSLQVNAWYSVAKPPQIAEIHMQIQNILIRTRRSHRCEEDSRLLEEITAQHAEELKTERAQRRRSEEKVGQLLETIRMQNQQLQLLTTLTMQNAVETESVTFSQQLQFQEQTEIIHQYVDQLATLALGLQGDEYPQRPTPRNARINETGDSIAELNPTSDLHTHQQHHRTKQRVVNISRDNRHRSVQLNQLSSREYDILIQLVEGNSYQEIAEYFQISPSTVRSYRSRIMQKLGLSNSTEMIKLAVRHGLITIR